MWMCSAVRSNASGRGERKPLVPARGDVLMAFAMALNREGACREIYARIQFLASVLHAAKPAVACCRAPLRGPVLPDNANQFVCEALPAGTEPSSSAEDLPTA